MGTASALSFRITTTMKRTTLTFLALGASLLTGGYLLGQSQSKSAAPAPQMKLVRVATLKTVEANREFQANVQLLQNQRQAALELNAAIEKEKDSKKKAELKSQFDAVMAKLNENNQLMQKTYGFSLDRNYVLEIEVAHIHVVVSEEEAAKLEKAEAEKKAPTDKKTEKKKK
jgi:hypothetical protein